MKKRSKEKRFPVKGVLITAAALILAAAGIFAVIRYTPGTKWADLEQIYGVKDGETAVFINDEKQEGFAVTDGDEIYLPYEMATETLNSRFYRDTEEEKLLYTLPEGNAEAAFSSSSYEYGGNQVFLEHPVTIERDGILYLSLEYISQFTNMRYSQYESPKRLYLDTRWETETKAPVVKNTQVRCRGGIKSEILAEVQKGDAVTILKEWQDWAFVRTQNGHIGYVQRKCLGDRYEEALESSFEEPVYPGVSSRTDGSIFLIWHDVYTKGANSTLEEMMEEQQGVTAISPTWFSLSGHEGGYTSIADSAYVEKAHNMGLEVWIRFDNFDTETYTYEALRKTQVRESLIKKLVAETVSLNADGINVDFEGIKKEAGEHYVQFLRELSLECHKAGLILSVDNYVPSPSRAHYNLEEQAVFADYVIIMGYDEHWKGSEAGSNASLPFTKRAIENSLESIPKEKLIHALPFYTRIWKETEAEAGTPDARHDGNSVYDYYTLEMTSCGMRKPWELFEQYGVTSQWNEELGQFYGEYEADGGINRIWVEDVKSIEEKMKLVSQADLAGCAAWKLGLEDPDVWSVIASYLK